MNRIIEALGPYAKAVILAVLIVAAAAADVAGLDLGLDPEHYAGLLVADFLVWLTPNRDQADRL